MKKARKGVEFWVMMNKRHIVIAGLVLGVLVLGGAQRNTKTIDVEIHDKMYTFELADTKLGRERGLMFRKKLDEDSGMLFIFEREDYLRFYMKDTFIPLDIAFVDSSFTVVDIRKMQPLDETIITSDYKARYALEVNRGFFEKAGLGIGDSINFTTALR